MTVNTPFIIIFDGTINATTSIGTYISNDVNPFALFLSAPCTAPSITTQPADNQATCLGSRRNIIIFYTACLKRGSVYYYVKVSNSCGSLLSKVVKFTVIAPSAPTIVTAAPTCTAAGTAKITDYSFTRVYKFSPIGPGVDSNGNITGITPGTTYSVAAIAAGCTSSATIFSVAAQFQTPTIIGASTLPEEGTSQLSGSGTPSVSTPWVSANVVVATISSTGLVKGISVGNSTITYTNSDGCNTSVEINVTQKNLVPICTTIPSPQFSPSATTTATLNGVSVSRAMSNPKFSTAQTSNTTNRNFCQANYTANYAWLYAEGTSEPQTVTYTFSVPQT